MSAVSLVNASTLAPWVRRPRWRWSWRSPSATTSRTRPVGGRHDHEWPPQVATLSRPARKLGARIDSLCGVDRALLCEFIAWLDRLPHSGNALLVLVGVQAVARLAAAPPAGTSTSRTRASLQSLSTQERRGASAPSVIARGARRGAGRMHTGYRIELGDLPQGREALAKVDRAAIAAFGLNRLNLDHLGMLLAVLHDRFGG